jgi:excinuclease ABC subunit A
MQFLSDIYIRCPECDGRRYRSHILEIKLTSASPGFSALSIADLLDSTIDEAVVFLETFGDSRPAKRANANLKLLQETGLGYLQLGQPINTLSGGESQRLKLVKHLAESLVTGERSAGTGVQPASRMLFLFDEPTTGLHFEDVRVLLNVFQRLVDAGHSLVVIEHNTEVIKSCDWVIDLGPEAGDLGGQIVAEGTPEQIAECERSYTGQALKQVLGIGPDDGARRSKSRVLPRNG